MPFFSKDIAVCDLIIWGFSIIEGVYLLFTIFAPVFGGFGGKYMSWHSFIKLIKKLAKAIEESGKQYKLIVAPGRGGAICAGLLSCYLGSVPVLVLDREYKTTPHGRKYAHFHEKQVILDPEYEHMKNDPILLLSQRSDPGITLNVLEDIMKKSGFTSIDQCAVLKSQKAANTSIRFCGYQYSSGDKHFKKFPWERIRQYRDIM